MRKATLRLARTAGISLVEVIMATAIGSIAMSVVIPATIAIQKSIRATDKYVMNMNAGSRLLDSIAQDLRRAVKVGRTDSGTYSKLADFTTAFAISETTQLAINIPDYYASNVPNNEAGSTYKLTRYTRDDLKTAPAYNGTMTEPILQAVVPWSEAVTTVGNVQTTRFAPASAGTGEVQVRYYRAPRSAQDSAKCFFRGEYRPGTNTVLSTREIAEQAPGESSLNLFVSDPAAGDAGMVFRLQSSFTPIYQTAAPSTAGTARFVDVALRNARRD